MSVFQLPALSLFNHDSVFVRARASCVRVVPMALSEAEGEFGMASVPVWANRPAVEREREAGKGLAFPVEIFSSA